VQISNHQKYAIKAFPFDMDKTFSEITLFYEFEGFVLLAQPINGLLNLKNKYSLINQ